MIDHLSGYSEENTGCEPRPGNESRHPDYFIGHHKTGTPHKPPEGEGNKWIRMETSVGLGWSSPGRVILRYAALRAAASERNKIYIIPVSQHPSICGVFRYLVPISLALIAVVIRYYISVHFSCTIRCNYTQLLLKLT